MRRLAVYTALFPPLALLTYVTADQLWRDGIPNFRFFAGLLVAAYTLAIIPAWLTAGVDFALSDRPMNVRFVATMSVAAILAEVVAYYMDSPSFDVPAALAGTLPAVICTWLAQAFQNDANVVSSRKS